MAEKINFDKSHQYHFHIVALFGSIIELCHTIIFLWSCDTRIAIPVIARTILEADLDLVNLSKDAKYGYRLELGFIRSWLDLLGNARRGGNPYLSELSNAGALVDEIKSHKNREQELNKRGYRKVEIKEKFELAEMKEEFGAIYPTLCSHSHNGLEALRERHAHIEGSEFSMVYFKSTGTSEFEEYVLMASEILLRAMTSINNIFNVCEPVSIEKIKNEFHASIGGQPNVA
ncbi:MAG: DUF5677 domain-containing protein [Spongiibacteraceae bacterium]